MYPRVRSFAVIAAGAIFAAGCTAGQPSAARVATSAVPPTSVSTSIPPTATTTVPSPPTTLGCPPSPTAVLTSTTATQTDNLNTSPPSLDWYITVYGTFTNPSQYPVAMNVDVVVTSTPVSPGPTTTSQFGVYPSDPAQLGLVPGDTTVDFQQDMSATEYIGGQPSTSIVNGWAYASSALAQCDQATPQVSQ